MQVYYIGDKIIHIHYLTQQDLYSAGNRFHVCYEHPQFKDTFQEDGGSWSGYNFPPYFISTFKEDFNSAEQELYNIAVKNPSKYIILTYEYPLMERTLIHELAHALYYTNNDYRSMVLQKLRTADLTNIKEVLSNYDASVLLDEAQAYLIEWNKLKEKLTHYGLNADQYLQLHLELTRIFDTHAANLRRIPLNN